MRVFTAMGAAVFVRCVFAGSGGVDGSLCCPNCPPGPCGKSRTALTPLSDDNIQDAVRAWCDDPASAAKVYGDIASWDTGAVTNMTYLFGTTADGGTCATFATFNEDVSRWNTSRVTSMYTCTAAHGGRVVLRRPKFFWESSNLERFFCRLFVLRFGDLRKIRGNVDPFWGTGPIDGAPSLVGFNNIQQGSYIISTRTLYFSILFQ